MPKTLIKPVKIFILAIVLVILSIFILNPREKDPTIEDYSKLSPSSSPQNETLKVQRSTEINSIIASALGNNPGRYAIFVKDLKANQTFEYRQQEIFTSASIYKLAVMYKTFDALAKRDLEKNDSLQTIDSTTAKKVSYSVDEALRLMITISDNESAILLAENFGWANIEKFLVNLGIENFKMSPSTQASAASTAQILELIYRGEAVSKSASDDMKNLLLAQTANDRIPKYLPKNIKVAHKTGELDSIRHDAGIVYGKNSDYIFVFFSDTPKPEIAAETIAQLSKEIYGALEN